MASSTELSAYNEADCLTALNEQQYPVSVLSSLNRSAHFLVSPCHSHLRKMSEQLGND